MRPLFLRMRGLTRFTDEVVLDLSELPPGTIAITGPNGAGKTTIMDALAAVPLYRTMSGKRAGKPLKDWCNGPAEVDVTIEHAGATYRHLLQIDPNARGGAGATKAYLYRNGEPLGAGGSDGGVRAYEDACKRIYPSADVFFASAFSSQDRSGSFMALDQVDRKELFAKLLGLGHLATLAERAAAKRKPLDAEAALFAREATTIAEQRARVVAATEALLGAEATLPEATERVTKAERAHTACVTAEADARTTLTRVQDQQRATRARLREIEQAERSADVAWREAAHERVQVEELLTQADAIRHRATRLATAQQVLATAQTQRDAAQATANQHTARLATLERDHHTLAGERARIERIATTLDHARAARDGALAAKRQAELDQAALDATPPVDLDGARRAVTLARQGAFAAEQEIALHKAALTEMRRKAGLLEGVPCKGGRVIFANQAVDPDEDPTADCGTCQFLADAKAADAQIAGTEVSLAGWIHTRDERLADEARMKQALLAVEAKAEERSKIERRLIEVRAMADRLPYTQRRLDEAEEAVEAMPHLNERAALLAQDIAAARSDKHNAVAAMQAAIAQHATAVRDAQDLLGADEDLRHLEAATARAPLLDRAVADAKARLDEFATQREALPPVDEAALTAAHVAFDAASLDRSEVEDSVRRARADLRTADTAVASAQGRLAGLGDPEAQQADLDRRRADVGLRRSGYVLLEAALGPNGVPALLVDHAAPEVSRLVGEILQACAGGRFSVALRTIQEAGGGRIQRELLDLQIFDGMRGAPRSVQALSGGEEVLISAALRAAICAFMARRQGGIGAAYFDELDAGLRGEWLARYPDLLRTARTLGGFRHLYYIPLAPELADAADARIVCADGRAWVEA